MSNGEGEFQHDMTKWFKDPIKNCSILYKDKPQESSQPSSQLEAVINEDRLITQDCSSNPSLVQPECSGENPVNEEVPATKQIKLRSQEHCLKIIVVGDYSVGKTALIRRFSLQKFDPFYKVTIGMEFSTKILKWDEKNFIKVNFWDIAGQERTRKVTRQFYHNSHAAILVCSLERIKSFENLQRWIENLKNYVVLSDDETPLPIVLFVNKCDLSSTQLTELDLNDICQKNNLDAWFATSAKDNINVEKGMNFAVKRALDFKHCIEKQATKKVEEEEVESIILQRTNLDVNLSTEKTRKTSRCNFNCKMK